MYARGGGYVDGPRDWEMERIDRTANGLMYRTFRGGNVFRFPRMTVDAKGRAVYADAEAKQAKKDKKEAEKKKKKKEVARERARVALEKSEEAGREVCEAKLGGEINMISCRCTLTRRRDVQVEEC